MSDTETEKFEIEIQSCMATGISVPVPADEDLDDMQPLSVPSAVGLQYLLDNEDKEWVRICKLDMPDRQRWLAIHEDNKEEFEGDQRFTHGAVFRTDKIEAEVEDPEEEAMEMKVDISGYIGDKIWPGAASTDVAVTREHLQDNSVMEAFYAMRAQVEEEESEE